MIQRIVTALILFAILAGSLYLGNTPFLIVMALAFALTLYEWLRIIGLIQKEAAIYGTVAFVAMAAFAYLGKVPSGEIFLAVILMDACVWVAMVAICFNARNVGFRLEKRQSYAMAIVFVPAAWFSLSWLMAQGGWPLMLSAFALVWAADIFAYVWGMTLGKHRMAPAISPKKSWEGAFGAFLTVYALALVAWQTLPHDIVFTSLVLERAGFFAGSVLVLILVAISIAGDLLESALKRQAGVKDSGSLLPGHGGFFDRLDAALAVLPSAVAILLVV